jgi:hypothetical protein
MAERADGVVVQHKADHLSMLETPQQVTMLIERAARTRYLTDADRSRGARDRPTTTGREPYASRTPGPW